MKLQFVILIMLVSATACVSQNSQVSETPNIIYILADDLGYGDLGCYNPESKLLTPRIDNMAKEGMLFTDVHSTHACTPTRYEILTGRYAFRALEPMRVLRSYDPPLIPEERLTVPKLLRENGYFTACIGKWHLGWDWPFIDGKQEPDFTQVIENGPVTRGFNEYFGTDVPNYPPYAFIENEQLTAQPTGHFPGGDRELFVFQSGPMVPDWKFEEIMPTLERRVVEFLSLRARDKKPFFLFYTLTIPHEPLAPSEGFLGKSGINRVSDLILETDAAVGAVLDALEELGLDRNTMVVFTSDNGHGPGTGIEMLLEAGHDPSRPFRGYKGSILEGGHRVPFIVKWPGRVKPGTVCNELVSLNSLMATCGELLDVTIPPDAGEDSQNILPLLLNRSSEYDPPVLVHAHNPNIWAIREGKWKLVRVEKEPVTVNPNRPQAVSGLYNLEEDPAELNNIEAQHPGIAEELYGKLKNIRFPEGFYPESSLN